MHNVVKIRLFNLVLKCIIFVSILTGSGYLSASPENKTFRVLYINSYHRGYKWSDGIEQGLREVLETSGLNIEISVEYLDSRRFADGAQDEPLARVFETKYKNYHPDVIVASDNAAFDFVMKYRKRLFQEIPVVFCGFNNFRPDVLKNISNVTGINEEISIEDTVKIALRVHPESHTLVFVTSTGEASSKRIREIAEESVFPKLRERFDLVIFKNASIDEIRQRLLQLPGNTILFITGQTIDKVAGREITPVENGKMICEVSPFPVYGFWDFLMNTGVLGGHIQTGPDQGHAAAELVLRILNGTPADKIPVIMTSPATDIFDYNVMMRFKISENQLPPGSTIINKPETFYHKYMIYVWITVSVFAVLSVMVIILVWLLRKSNILGLKLRAESEERRKVLVELQRHKDHLEVIINERTLELRKTYGALHEREVLFHRMFDMHSAAMYLLNPDTGRIIDVNQSALAFYGYTEEQMKSMDIYSINQLSKDELESKMQLAKAGQYKNFEFRHRLANGDIRDVEVHTTPITYKGEEILFSIVHDITDRKTVEAEREKLITELKDALAEVKTPSGLLPICASCKKIRNDEGYWEQIETYIGEHSEAEFTHGLCPDCAAKLYPGYKKKV